MDEADPLSEAEIAARRTALAALKLHPREESGNMAVLARATRCYEGFIGERRDMVGRWITAFEAALESQDPRRIGEARSELAAALDAVEGERFL
jgi:molecular chaperone HscC